MSRISSAYAHKPIVNDAEGIMGIDASDIERSEAAYLRRHRLKKRLAAIVGAVTVSISFWSISLPAAASPAPSKCDAAVILIGARGTGEAPGIGGTNAVVESLFKSDDQIPTWTLAVDYPAIAYTGTESYFSSVKDGAANLRAQIVATVGECPYSNIVLIGYSQGADVIGTVLEGIETTPLDENARNHILSVAFFGDPTFRAGEAYNAEGSGTGDGLFPRPAGALSSWTRLGYPTPDTVTPVPVPIIRSYCFTGDRFCQKGLGPDAGEIHESYDSTVTADAYFFLRDFIFDNSRRAVQTPALIEEPAAPAQ
jgi:hypothetical protein